MSTQAALHTVVPSRKEGLPTSSSICGHILQSLVLRTKFSTLWALGRSWRSAGGQPDTSGELSHNSLKNTQSEGQPRNLPALTIRQEVVNCQCSAPVQWPVRGLGLTYRLEVRCCNWKLVKRVFFCSEELLACAIVRVLTQQRFRKPLPLVLVLSLWMNRTLSRDWDI